MFWQHDNWQVSTAATIDIERCASLIKCAGVDMVEFHFVLPFDCFADRWIDCPNKRVSEIHYFIYNILAFINSIKTYLVSVKRMFFVAQHVTLQLPNKFSHGLDYYWIRAIPIRTYLYNNHSDYAGLTKHASRNHSLTASHTQIY